MHEKKIIRFNHEIAPEHTNLLSSAIGDETEAEYDKS